MGWTARDSNEWGGRKLLLIGNLHILHFMFPILWESRDCITIGVHALKTPKYRHHLKSVSLTRNVFKHTIYLARTSSKFFIESSYVNPMVDIINARR